MDKGRKQINDYHDYDCYIIKSTNVRNVVEDRVISICFFKQTVKKNRIETKGGFKSIISAIFMTCVCNITSAKPSYVHARCCLTSHS